jgi:hypothetical protein
MCQELPVSRIPSRVRGLKLREVRAAREELHLTVAIIRGLVALAGRNAEGQLSLPLSAAAVALEERDRLIEQRALERKLTAELKVLP